MEDCDVIIAPTTAIGHSGANITKYPTWSFYAALERRTTKTTINFEIIIALICDLSSLADVHAGLGGTLVATSLQADHRLASLQLLFSEFTHVLLRRLGSDCWTVKSITLGLKLAEVAK